MQPSTKPVDGPGLAAARPVRTAKAKVCEVVLVCTKCGKRCAKGRGLPKGALRDRLKAEIKQSRPKPKLRIVETGCLGPCPKRLIAVATGASVAKGRVLLIDPEAPAAEILAALLPDRAARDTLPQGAGIGEGREPPG